MGVEDSSMKRAAGLDAAEGVIIVDRLFRPVAVDSGAEAIIELIEGGARAAGTLHALPSTLRAALDGRSPHELVTSHLHLDIAGGSYNCRIFWMEPHNDGLDQSLLAIHLRRQQSVDEVVRRIAGVYRLTEREQQAVIGISMGLTSKELAEWMNISFNTVNTFLRTIMVKMSVTTRAGVVGKLLEQTTGAALDGAARESEGRRMLSTSRAAAAGFAAKRR
jgi:DNA-binding NarL/FixJ family response regulator